MLRLLVMVLATGVTWAYALCGGAVAQSTHASPAAGTAPTALPGVHRVGIAGQQQRALSIAGSAGYGYTESVLNQNDSHHRIMGGLALGLRFLPWLAVAAKVDGRYDKHSGDSGSDDGLVGDPRLKVRADVDLDSGFALGAEVGAWFPGAVAPSLSLDATTLEGLALASFRPDEGALTLGLQAGFRWDNSANSADEADRLSNADRLALGVSDFNALLLGFGLSWRLSQIELLAEYSAEPLLGSNAPSFSKSPMRVGAGARWHPSQDLPLQLQLFGEVATSSRPPVAVAAPLVPIEPRFSVVLAVMYAVPFDAEKTEAKPLPPPPPPKVEPKKQAAPKPAVLTGRIVDTGGNGVLAQVQVGEGDGVQTVQTEADGSFRLEGLPQGPTLVKLQAKGYRDSQQSVVLKPGETLELDIALEIDLPQGQIRGLVRSYDGHSLAATILVNPIGIQVQADSEGVAEIDVPPGRYTVVISMPGYREQRRNILVEERGVTVLNIDLRETRKNRRRR